MRLVASIFLLLAMLLSASGVLTFVHGSMHEANAGKSQAGISAGLDAPGPQGSATQHEACPVCAGLHQPGDRPAGHVWLVATGEWVRYVSMLAAGQYAPGYAGRMS